MNALWERKSASVLIALAVGLILYIAACDPVGSMPRDDRRLAYLAVLCPPDWRATVSQRYDDRDRSGRIVRSTWITRCI